MHLAFLVLKIIILYSLQLSRSSEDDTEPLDTVVTFTKRRTAYSDAAVSQDTEVELAKLYAHVQSMPDSAKKRKLMKQVDYVDVLRCFFMKSDPGNTVYFFLNFVLGDNPTYII